jgi:hypothetical protein
MNTILAIGDLLGALFAWALVGLILAVVGFYVIAALPMFVDWLSTVHFGCCCR